MAALDDATTMSTDNTYAILDLYKGNSSTCKVPPSMTKDRGDEATVSPAMSVAQACSK